MHLHYVIFVSSAITHSTEYGYFPSLWETTTRM